MKKEWVTYPIVQKKFKVLNLLCSASLMITLSNNTKGLALLHQVVEIYGKVYSRFFIGNGSLLVATKLYPVIEKFN